MMNIKDKIIEWQKAYVDAGSFLDDPERNLEAERDLELVLFVIDKLKDHRLNEEGLNEV